MSNQDQHCLICNSPVNSTMEMIHCIFSKLELTDSSTKSSVFTKVGEILNRSLSNIKIHSDVVCQVCYLLLRNYTELELKLCSLRSDFIKKFDITASTHASTTTKSIKKTHSKWKSKNSGRNFIRIINEEGKLVVVEESEAEGCFSCNNDCKEIKCIKTQEKNVCKDNSDKNQTLPRPHTCPVCKKSFRAHSHCAEHMTTHTNEKPFVCKECNKPYRSKRALRSHLLKHTGQKSYKCQICQKSYSSLSSLNDHKSLHSGVKPFECQHCSLKFRRKKDLVVHSKTHTGEKHYTCTMCPKTFAVISRLKRHMLIHSGEKMHECDHCLKSFTRKHDLEVHVRLHTGEKPFQCTYCPKTFTHRSNRLAHMRTHSKCEAFSCNICKRSFSRRSKLKEHLKKQHSDDPTNETVVCKVWKRQSKVLPIPCSVIKRVDSTLMPVNEPLPAAPRFTELKPLEPVPAEEESEEPSSLPLPPTCSTFLYSLAAAIVAN